MNNTKNVQLRHNHAITSINGNCIERFYYLDKKLVHSRIVCKCDTKETAQVLFMDYYQPQRSWYLIGGRYICASVR